MTWSFCVFLSFCCLKFRQHINEDYWKLLPLLFLSMPPFPTTTPKPFYPMYYKSSAPSIQHDTFTDISNPTIAYADLCFILSSCCCESYHWQEAVFLKHFLPVL